MTGRQDDEWRGMDYGEDWPPRDAPRYGWVNAPRWQRARRRDARRRALRRDLRRRVENAAMLLGIGVAIIIVGLILFHTHPDHGDLRLHTPTGETASTGTLTPSP